MKSWENIEPDRYRLMNKHYTPGRGGNKIECLVIHHNAGVLSIDQIWQVWQTREASAHFQVQSDGEIGQLVNDWDTAWHAANQYTNQRSIGIEISNCGGPDQDWPIADKAIEEAAHLIAALCKYYKLGRPVSGDNIRYHKEFWGTSCPYHLAPGGKYNARLIGRAQHWYDVMTRPAAPARPVPKPAPAPEKPKVGKLPNGPLTPKYFTDFLTGYLGPQIDALQEVWTQLRGPGGKGWPQLGQDNQGRNLTPIDALAAIRHQLAQIQADLDELKRRKK